MPERAEDIAREAFGKVRDVLFWILFWSWTLGWLAIGGLGSVIGSPDVFHAGMAMAAGSAVVLGGGRLTRRLVLTSRAKTSLIARARLESLRLNRDAEAVLGAFDHSYERALGLLGAPEIAGVAAEARHNRGRVREQIYDLISTEMRLRLDAKKLRRLRTVGAVSSALGDAEQQMRALHNESDTIAQDTQRLADRLDRVRQLAAGPSRSTEAQDGIARVLEDLDQTASAYEEIERERLESDEARAERLLKARRPQAQ